MSDGSPIGWLYGKDGSAGASWNLFRGCTRKSPGCGGPGPHGGCYAENMAGRFSDEGMWGHGYATRTPNGARWTGEIGFVPELLDLPLKWKRARRIFVNSTSDCFHEKVKWDWLLRMFAIMQRCPRHSFIILTKRPEIMADFIEQAGVSPLPNVWLGTSIENQQYADERLPFMRRVHDRGWHTLVSYEPALGPVRWTGWEFLDWIVIGGESGPRARDFYLHWMADTLSWAMHHDIAAFGKQLGAKPVYAGGTPMTLKDKKGDDMEEWPLALRVRESPMEMA